MLLFLNQPEQNQLGELLLEKLSDEKYKRFTIVSAFAKNSGVLRIKKALQIFRDQGNKIDAFIGIDANGTSYQALYNLFHLVDNLYVIHDYKPLITFHPKAYCFSDLRKDYWIAVGSNNLTGGGLWSNIEWSTIIEDDVSNSDFGDYIEAFYKQIDLYMDDEREYSRRINDLNDLDDLLESGLLKDEMDIQIERNKQARKSGSLANRAKDSFGSRGGVYIPALDERNDIEKPHKKSQDATSSGTTFLSTGEKMWFELRSVTGGSGNQIDLSKEGRIVKGSGAGTRYDIKHKDKVNGSVAFFDMDPFNEAVKKDVTVNYKGVDYEGCTIKIYSGGVRPNKSWRILLNGENKAGEKLTTAEGSKWIANNLIVLEKITTSYYAMYVLPASDLKVLEASSVFVARNGRSSVNGKLYGLLDT